MPFIRLEEPHLKNLPSPEKTKRYEDYMRLHVPLSNATGTFFDASTFFLPSERNDLAFVFESALTTWVTENKGTVHMTYTRRITYDSKGHIIDDDGDDIVTLHEFCQDYEKRARATLSKVIQDHLNRTGGSIGLFPYSGERVLMTFLDEDTGQSESVKLDPFSLYWPNVIIYALQETADLNNPAMKKPVNPKHTLAYRIQKRSKIFKFSAASALISFVIMRLIEILNFSPPLLVIDLFGTSFIVSIVSLFLLLRSLLEKRQIRERKKSDPFIQDGFETHFASIGFGCNATHEIYDKRRFEQEVKELHQYFRFIEIWSDTTGREIDFLRKLNFRNFYESVAPFVINGDKYIH